MSLPNYLTLFPLSPSKLPQPNVVLDLHIVIVLYEITLEKFKKSFSTLGIISLDKVSSEQTSQREMIPSS
jgi:hypothetical protein